MGEVKEVILTKDIQVRSVAGRLQGEQGTLMIVQNGTGGHLVTVGAPDLGFVDVALSPGGRTQVSWTRVEGKTVWSSVKITSDVPIAPPSTIDSLIVEITDTVSSKIKWNAPQGFTGSDDTPVDLYYLVLSTSPIDPQYNYDLAKLTLIPQNPNTPESYIIPNLNSGQRYYAALYSEKLAFGKVKRSAMSNVVNFFTTALDGSVETPKRIPIYPNMIWESLLHINFAPGEIFTNYPSFKRLGYQDHIIDNNGVPEVGEAPWAIVSAYQSYGTLQPSWYNVGKYTVIFELDGFYDLNYIYILAQNQNRFSISLSGDGVTRFKAFDKEDTPITMAGVTKIPLLESASTNVKFIMFELYVGDEWFNAFVPYGTRKTPYEIKGEKYKEATPARTFTEQIGTNVFLAENDPDLVGDVSKIARLYTNVDWLFPDPSVYPGKNWGPGTHQSATPDDIEMVSATSHMWNFNEKMAEFAAEGQKEFITTWVNYAPYLRTGTYQPGENITQTKPVDPGLNFRDLTVTTNPQSYKHAARMAASQAYLWGFNTDAPEMCNQFIDSAGQKGLGLCRYYEFGNEQDRFWATDNAFFNPQEAAAYTSAMYDGHKGALGAGFGIKSADPSSKLLMAGLLNMNPSYIREMLLWWDLYRGPGDYPVDGFNFHHYNAFQDAADTPVYSNVTAYGIPPEAGNLVDSAKEVVRLARLMSPSTEVICSEHGYDEQYGGMHSPPDRQATLRGRHKAVWILRTYMIYKIAGLSYTTQYWYHGDTVRVEDLDPNTIQRELFYTSGLFDGITWAGDRNVKPLIAAWYVTAFMRSLEDYNFTHSIMHAGQLMISEETIVLNYHPKLWILAFEHKTLGTKQIVAWIGGADWETFQLDLRVTNEVTSLPTINFLNQDARLSKDGVTVNVAPLVGDTGKHVLLDLSETPLVIKTELVGTKKLIVPKNVQLQSTTPTSVKITWTDENIGTNKARIYRSTEPGQNFNIIEEVYRDNAETTIIGLQENTTYYWIVQFVDGPYVSALSPTSSITTTFLLVAPTNLRQDGATASTLTLKWDYSVEDESHIQKFVIYRSNTDNGEYVEVGRVDANLREFRDIGLTASTPYFYKVRSYKDGVVSNFSFTFAASTIEPSVEPPTIQSAVVSAAGSSMELTFNEELKDEQTAINAFSISERLSDGTIVMHPVRVITLLTDKTKLRLDFNIPFFKSSTGTLSYSASLGFLKSIYNIAVNTFSSYNVTNSVAQTFSPILDWGDVTGLTINRNSLTGIAGGKAVAKVKIPNGATAILRFSTGTSNSMIIGLDSQSDPEGFNTMDYYMSRQNGVIDYKKVNTVSSTAVQFTIGQVQFRSDGTTIYFEVSYDNGVTWTLITTTPQPPIDLYIKVYTNGAPENMLNVVGQGLLSTVDTIVPDPPTAMVIDDDEDTVGFTLNPLYSALTDYEFSSNLLALSPSWATVITNPILVGDVSIPIGGFGIRVKAATGRTASAPLTNPTAFTGTINTSGKIMVQKSSGGTVLFSTNTLEELLTWLAGAVITEPINVQFNTGDIWYVPSTFSPVFNNGIHKVTFKGATGVRPIFDGQRVPSSVWRFEQGNTRLENLELKNADIENLAGCIIRADQKTGVELEDIILDYGFCGMRATTGFGDATINNIIVRNTKEGSFRLGNDTTIDQQNIRITNIKLDDVTNGGLIEGTTYPYFGGFTLKATNGYHIENVGALSGDRLYFLGNVEYSENVVIKNVRGTHFDSLSVDNIKYINCHLPASNYLSEGSHYSFIHCYMLLTFAKATLIDMIRGCVFPLAQAINGILMEPTDMPAVESDNVFVGNSDGVYHDWHFFNDDSNIKVTVANLAAYKATGKGNNSLFIPYADRATLNLNPFGSLRGNSAGKGLVTATIESVTDDIYGTPRTYPTDPSPYGGSRPDVNDTPAPPTVTGDNVARTLVASHALGSSEILVSTNDGLYLPYAGTINVGDLEVAGGYYKFKIKAAAYRDESAIAYSPSFTAAPDEGDYEVLRTFEVNIRSEFCDSSLDANVNEYFGSGATPISGTDLVITLEDKTGTASAITMGNFEQGFDGAACVVIPEPGVGINYIRDKNAIMSGISLNKSTPSKIKLTGLNDALFYQFYFVSGTNEDNQSVKITIGDSNVTKVTTGNYPYIADGDFNSNPAVIKIYNRQSTAGELIIQFEKAGSSYQQVMMNYLIMEESNEEKPL